MKRMLVAVAAATALAAPSAALAAQPANPGCAGKVVAGINHSSGVSGASGNPQSSAGPGYFLRQGTSEAVHGAMDELCA